MATDVTLPELGENITSATVLEVLVAPGDSVEKDQPVLSLESEKAEFDLPSPAAGTIAEILVKKGDEVEVGQLILRLEASGEKGAAKGEPRAAVSQAPAREERAATKPKASDAAADEAREDASAEPAESPANGRAQAAEPRKERPAQAPVKVREEKRERLSPAASHERPARDDMESRTQPRASRETPERRAERAASREEVKSSERARGGREAEATRARDGERASEAPPAAKTGAPIAAAPSVRRLARELGVDIAEVAAGVRDGRVSAEDVYRHVRKKLAPDHGDGAAAKGEASRDYSRWGEVRIEEMSTVRRRTAENMSRAWSTIPHVTHHDTADIQELDRLRAQFAPRVERAGGKLTITAVLLKVLGSALRRYPKFNASVDMDRAQIVYKEFINIGVAVDTERGLLVPVIRNADEKNIVELALELHELSEGARTRKLRPDALQGATFTLTNLGGIGGTHFSPIINPPEVAVLGVSRGSTKPVWVEGKFEPRLMMPLSVTYDHRLIDGADAARFLRWVCEALEEPFLMDLEGD